MKDVKNQSAAQVVEDGVKGKPASTITVPGPKNSGEVAPAAKSHSK